MVKSESMRKVTNCLPIERPSLAQEKFRQEDLSGRPECGIL